jgi:hypothetical protein
VFALLSFVAFPDHAVVNLLREKLGITEFRSARAHFREPWFAKSRPRAERVARELWGAKGPAGACARRLRDVAFHPLARVDRPIDDYWDKGESEAQFAAFLRNVDALKRFASHYASDRNMFAALEAVDISDLFRDMPIWVTQLNDASGDVSFADLSDGKRQLLMVLGLVRVPRAKPVCENPLYWDEFPFHFHLRDAISSPLDI